MIARVNDIPVAVLIVLVLTLLILGVAYLAAWYTIWRDEREIERRAKANVEQWWFDSAPPEYLGEDDGSDEGLVRLPPDVLLRETLDARKEA